MAISTKRTSPSSPLFTVLTGVGALAGWFVLFFLGMITSAVFSKWLLLLSVGAVIGGVLTLLWMQRGIVPHD